MLGIVVVSIYLGLSFLFGIYFWVYWYLRNRLTRVARDKQCGRPVRLFIQGLLCFVVSIVTMFGLMVGYLYLMNTKDWKTMVVLTMVLTSLLAGTSLAGAIGWMVMGVQRLTCHVEMKRFEAAFPLPKLQLWMQDLLVAAFFFALCLGLLVGFGSKLNRSTEEVAALSAGMMLCMGCGLYFALDVCRRSLRLQAAWPRLLFIIGVILYTTILFLIPAWLTWRAWRYAMWKAGWVLGQDLVQKQRAEAGMQ